MNSASTMSTAGSNRTVADRIAEAFSRHGVSVVFGQSIPTAFHLAAPHHGIRQAAYRAENAGGIMADGYARIANRVSVVTAQNGPAATLLVPPLAEALKASVPVVALVQDVPAAQADKNAFQEFDHVRLFDAVAKWVRRIERPERVDDYVDMAFTAAASGRPGPAVLLAPADVLSLPAGPAPARQASLGRFPVDRAVADPARIAEAAALLAGAQAPLLVAGGGVHLSAATAALAHLQEACSLPVATTVMGKGTVDETHPLSLGVIGYFMGPGSRTRAMRPLVEEADVILFVGARTNQNGTDSWSLFPPEARYIHLDVDGAEVGRNYEALRLVGDARLTLEALAERMGDLDLSRRARARAEVSEAIATALRDWRNTIERITTEDRRPIRPERLMAEIDAVLTPQTITVADASYSSIWIANYLTARGAGQRFLTPRGLAGLGWGLPFAIGAQFAEPARPVICVSGDGGFAHCWAELETVVRHKLPIVMIVLNNQILGYQKHGETVVFNAYTDAVDFVPVDHAAIARACGCEGVRIEDPAEFGPRLRQAIAARKPVLFDVIIDEDAHPPITGFGDRFASPF
ncbi:acetolactate synthase catalytic subunit [Labrys wisconsinensis]|uniref:Acetolactate synthase-1/2/3 large subunit n=1 Tax=Labrys wisconsinensis TaxID=425677 RepID=A0ABU0JC90_9HYPH|nr:acetolactate synthase catalytic subunit [Labrys wisconsinensis]MDQ0471893.1 acetolactate synthase-1/2/3 large subunit [Labrys wisconsinensis]